VYLCSGGRVISCNGRDTPDGLSLLTRREPAALARDEAMNCRQICLRFRHVLFVQAVNTNRRAEENERRPLWYTDGVIRIGPCLPITGHNPTPVRSCCGDHNSLGNPELSTPCLSLVPSISIHNQPNTIWLQLHDISDQRPQGCPPGHLGQRHHIERFRHLHGSSQYPATVVYLSTTSEI
jgi:hypothetical protein